MTPVAGEAIESTLLLHADHPALAGHFPGHPIVPGVVLLDEALFAIESAGAATPAKWTIAAAKFFNPIAPGAVLTLRHERVANGSIRFDISEGTRKIAGGSLVARGDEGGDAGGDR